MTEQEIKEMAETINRAVAVATTKRLENIKAKLSEAYKEIYELEAELEAEK